MEKKKSVGIWIRVSTEFQVKDDSPEHHEERAKYYAAAKGWEVVEVYRLEAVSGKSVMEHHEAKRMIHDVEAGRIGGLIFSKLARLARNTKELLEFSEIFREHNCDLVSLSENIDTSTPAGRLFYTMIAALAEWERSEIAERVAASVPVRARMGKPLGGQGSLGYRWVEKSPGVDELIVDEQEAPIRKLIYDLFVEHKRKTTVAKILNERGHRTRNGSQFSDTTIGRLLRDPIAKGERRANYTKSLGDNKKWVVKPEAEWIITPCPAIVSKELWDECNQILAEHEKKLKRPAKKAVHLFTGIVYCNTCDIKMYVPSESKKYVCLKCRKIRIDMLDLEEIYYENLKTFLLTDEHLETFISKADSTIQSKEYELKSLLEEKRKIEAEMDKLVSLHMAGEIPREGFGKHYNPLHEQVKQIERAIPEIQSEIDFLKIELLNGDQLLQDARSLYDRWPSLTPQNKREIVEQVTDKVLISKDEINIKFTYTPNLPQIAADSQRNLIRVLPFWNVTISFKNPYSLAFSAEIGDQIRQRRLSMGLLQKDVAQLIGVSEDCITYWENKRSLPFIHQFPAIIKFLGFNPFKKEGDSLSIRIQNYRIEQGLSHKKLGKKLGINPSTISSWEKGKFLPNRKIYLQLKEMIRNS